MTELLTVPDMSRRLSQSGKLKRTLEKTGYATETYTYQTKSPNWPANTGKDSCEVYTNFFCLLSTLLNYGCSVFCSAQLNSETLVLW